MILWKQKCQQIEYTRSIRSGQLLYYYVVVYILDTDSIYIHILVSKGGHTDSWQLPSHYSYKNLVWVFELFRIIWTYPRVVRKLDGCLGWGWGWALKNKALKNFLFPISFKKIFTFATFTKWYEKKIPVLYISLIYILDAQKYL